MYETWSDKPLQKPPAGRRLRMLVESSQLVARVITNSIGLSEAASLFLKELVEATGWDVAILYKVEDFDQRIRFAGSHQQEQLRDSALVARSRSLGLMPGEGLAGQALALGQPLWVHNEPPEPWFCRHVEATRDGIRTGLAVPVRAGSRTVGVIELFSRELKPHSRELVEILGELASPIGSIIAHARSEELKRILDEANTALFGSLDSREGLDTVARLCVPRLTDVCVIHCLDDEGLFSEQVAAAHVEEATAELLRELGSRIRLPIVGRLESVLREGRAVLFEQVDPAEIARYVGDERHAAALRQLDLASVILVPLQARGRVFGFLLLATTGRRRYVRDDLGVAEEVGRRASLAIDNGRLFESERKARSMAEAATQAKDEFLAVLSHELRTPLQSMLGWTQMLRSRRLDDETAQRGLAAIERATRAQAQLIGDLLDVSRIVAGKLSLDPERVDLVPIIDAAIEAVRGSAEAKQIRLERNVEVDRAGIFGDKYRLQQIVTNLLSNAIKFTGPGGQVTVRLTCDEESAKLVVEDNGIGIRPDFLPYVFDRFLQADSTSRRAHGGLGLGLTIVKHLVTLHGGTVTAFSEGENKGARFEVVLPLVSPDDDFELAPESVDLRALPRLDGAHVLVVDDDDETRELIRTLLSGCGASVTAVRSAKLALESLAAQQPDLLISDVRMPDEDGYAFIRRVRALEKEWGRSKPIPAIALTADASATARERALAEGFQHHLAKPVQAMHLAKLIVASLEKKPAS